MLSTSILDFYDEILQATSLALKKKKKSSSLYNPEFWTKIELPKTQ